MISKTCGYAIRGVLLLALDDNRERKIGIHEIAEELNVPQHFMGKIMQELVRKGLINSTKGPHGGFYPKHDVLDMNLIKIVEAIDGLTILNKCFLGREECSDENPCPMHREFDRCRSVIFQTFNDKTVGSLIGNIELQNTFLEN
jgi:Rrf2 family protein